MYSRIFSAVMVVITSWSLLLQPPAAFPQENSTPLNLHVIVLKGSQDPINNLKTRTAREVVVQVEDENRKPVAGALVTFRLPYSGAGGNSFNGGKIIESITDARGQAIGRFQPSGVGQFKIDVTATSGGKTGATVISETNIFPAQWHFLGMNGKTLAIVGSVAAAGTAAAVVAAKGGGGATISPGVGTVGAPR